MAKTATVSARIALTSCLCSTQPASKCYQAAIQAKTSRLYTRKTIITVQI